MTKRWAWPFDMASRACVTIGLQVNRMSSSNVDVCVLGMKDCWMAIALGLEMRRIPRARDVDDENSTATFPITKKSHNRT